MKFYNSILKLDNILIKENISNKDIITIRKLIKNNSIAIYFWRNLDQCKWFLPLKNAGFFELLSMSFNYHDDLYRVQVFIVDYLYKVADIFPSEVISILKSATSNNETAIRNFVDIGLKLPPKYTSEIVPFVKKWSKNEAIINSTLFDHNIIRWVSHLIDGGEGQSAIKLIKIIATPKAAIIPKAKEPKISKTLDLYRSKAIALIDSYYLKEMFLKEIGKVIEQEPLELVNILSDSLEKAIYIEYSHVKGKNDLSYIWRPAIENHSQNYNHNELIEVLLVALRDTLQIIASTQNEIALPIIKKFLNHKYSIFRRLAIHLLRLNSENYWDLIDDLSNNNQLLNEVNISHEYYILLRDNFTKFTESKRDIITNFILTLNNTDPNASPEVQEKQKRYDWLEKLHFFEKDLTNNYKFIFENLKREFQQEKIHDTVTWHESYYGEKSPFTPDELQSKSINDIWQICMEYDKVIPKFGEPSSEGLARTIGEVFKMAPEKYLIEDLTPLIDISPNYSYWIMNQIAELLQKDKLIGNNKIILNLLKVCSRLMKLNDIPPRFTNDMGINFTGVRMRILDIVQALIKTHQKEFQLDYRELIWDIIYYLCFLESASVQESEKDDLGTDPVTQSLNTVKGTAMHTLIDYALWYAYHTKQYYLEDSYPDRFRGEERIRFLLEDKLDKTNEPSFSVHSIYGLFLPNLAYLSRTWLQNNLPKIFPDGEQDKNYWKAAWNAYICYSRFYKDIYYLLLPQFETALNYLTRKEPILPSNIGRSSEKALAEHLIIACINGLDNVTKTDSLLRRFAMIPGNKNMTHAIQYISNLAKNEKIFFTKEEFWEQAKYLWDIRIKAVSKEIRKVADLSEDDEYDMEFGTYIGWLDDLPSNVTIKEIESLLSETIKINRKGWHLPNLIDYLAVQSTKHPKEAIKLLYQLTCTKAPQHFYHGKEKEIKTILSNAIRSGSNFRTIVESIINKFGEGGNYYFKGFWIDNFLPSFDLSNITLNDIKHNRIRILADKKKYFPLNADMQRNTYFLKLLFDNLLFNVRYTIGSKDKRLRSGCLVFEDKDYLKLNVKEGMKIKMVVLNHNKLYKILLTDGLNIGV